MVWPIDLKTAVNTKSFGTCTPEAALVAFLWDAKSWLENFWLSLGKRAPEDIVNDGILAQRRGWRPRWPKTMITGPTPEVTLQRGLATEIDVDTCLPAEGVCRSMQLAFVADFPLMRRCEWGGASETVSNSEYVRLKLGRDSYPKVIWAYNVSHNYKHNSRETYGAYKIYVSSQENYNHLQCGCETLTISRMNCKHRVLHRTVRQ